MRAVLTFLGSGFLALIALFAHEIAVEAQVPCPRFDAPIAVGQLTDPRWTGLSGLAASRRNPDVWWVHNDGGSGPNEAGMLYAITSEGRLLATYVLPGVSELPYTDQESVDIEDIAVAPGPNGQPYLYIGDIGGNRNRPSGRNELRIFLVQEPEVPANPASGNPIPLPDYATLRFTYPDGGRFDAETLMVDANADLYVVTKRPSSGTSTIYQHRAPHDASRPAALTAVGTLQFGSATLPGDTSATAGDISADGNEIIIRTYDRIFLWRRDAQTSLAETVTTTEPCVLPGAPPQFYEAVAFDASGKDVYDTVDANSDGTTEPLQRYQRRGLYDTFLPLSLTR